MIKKNLFPFPLVTAKLISDYFDIKGCGANNDAIGPLHENNNSCDALNSRSCPNCPYLILCEKDHIFKDAGKGWIGHDDQK